MFTVDVKQQQCLLIWIRVGQGPTALAVGAGRGCLDIFFSRLSLLFFLPLSGRRSDIDLSTCPAKNQAGCIERVVHHSHENQKIYLFKIATNEKCQKPKLTVKVIMVAMATAV